MCEGVGRADAPGQRVDDGLGFFDAHLLGERGVGEPSVREVYEREYRAEAYGGLVSVEELFEGVRVAFAPLGLPLLDAFRGVFALSQLCEECC